MANEEMMQAPPLQPEQAATQQEPESLTPEEESDLNITVMLAEKVIDDGGMQVIDEAIKTSRDPGQVIGQFLMQLVSQLGESMPEDMTFSPRIFFAEGGWIEQVSDYLQEQYDVPKDVMDRAEMYIGGTAQQIAQVQQSQAQQQMTGTTEGPPLPQTQPGQPMPQGPHIMPGGQVMGE